MDVLNIGSGSRGKSAALLACVEEVSFLSGDRSNPVNVSANSSPLSSKSCHREWRHKTFTLQQEFVSTKRIIRDVVKCTSYM